VRITAAWVIPRSRHVKLSRVALTALLMLVAVARGADAGPLEDAEAAMDRGDYATAYRLWRPLADQGDARAQYKVGDMYHWGLGPPQDYAEALKWLRKAADQGNAEAQVALAYMYETGDGVSVDYVEAVKRLRRGSDQGYARAQGNLGDRYAKGEGVPQDYVQAYLWFNLAVPRFPDWDWIARGITISLRDSIGAKMSPDQIAEAQKLTREWKPPSPQILLTKVGGTYVVPVEINGAITLDFTVDSGAADVSVPLDVYSTLRRKGTIKDSDVIGEQTYKLADGSTSQSFTFVIRSLKVGDIVVENVTGGVGPIQGSLLLGQSFLERFKSWSIDNTNHVLLLEPSIR
jgi:clan AA aspartic protease (TIGR02281 family)